MLTLAASGSVARVVEAFDPPPVPPHCWIDGAPVPLVSPPKYGAVVGVPEGVTDSVLVSALVGQRLAELGGFTNVFSPASGPGHAIRDKATGKLAATRALVKWC
jgi:hypothetical protein